MMRVLYICAFFLTLAGCISPVKGKYYVEAEPKTSTLVVYASSGRQIGVIRMTKNTKFCKPINDGKAVEYAPVIIPPKTSAPTESEYNDAGWYKNEIHPPEVPEGKIVSSITYFYHKDLNAVVADYRYEDAPKQVRTFSKLKLYGALVQAGLWDTFEAWLKT